MTNHRPSCKDLARDLLQHIAISSSTSTSIAHPSSYLPLSASPSVQLAVQLFQFYCVIINYYGITTTCKEQIRELSKKLSKI